MRNLGPLALGCVLVILLPLVCACGHSDCQFARSVAAWVDENANGVREAGEPLLTGVVFSAQNRLGPGGGEKDADPYADQVTLTFLYLCGRAKWDVTARPPAGYHNTTPATVTVDKDNDDPVIMFGFVRDPK
jgi:hypothetical protein